MPLSSRQEDQPSGHGQHADGHIKGDGPNLPNGMSDAVPEIPRMNETHSFAVTGPTTLRVAANKVLIRVSLGAVLIRYGVL
jgi:hypothetical protein